MDLCPSTMDTMPGGEQLQHSLNSRHQQLPQIWCHPVLVFSCSLDVLLLLSCLPVCKHERGHWGSGGLGPHSPCHCLTSAVRSTCIASPYRNGRLKSMTSARQGHYWYQWVWSESGASPQITTCGSPITLHSPG